MAHIDDEIDARIWEDCRAVARHLDDTPPVVFRRPVAQRPVGLVHTGGGWSGIDVPDRLIRLVEGYRPYLD